MCTSSVWRQFSGILMTLGYLYPAHLTKAWKFGTQKHSRYVFSFYVSRPFTWNWHLSSEKEKKVLQAKYSSLLMRHMSVLFKMSLIKCRLSSLCIIKLVGFGWYRHIHAFDFVSLTLLFPKLVSFLLTVFFKAYIMDALIIRYRLLLSYRCFQTQYLCCDWTVNINCLILKYCWIINTDGSERVDLFFSCSSASIQITVLCYLLPFCPIWDWDINSYMCCYWKITTIWGFIAEPHHHYYCYYYNCYYYYCY